MKTSGIQLGRRASRNVAPLMLPLPLFREILRAHRKLPQFQRSLGDSYVRAEFKAHKNIDNPLHIVGFLQSWQDYLVTMTGDKWKEFKLSKGDLEKMSPEQVGQVSMRNLLLTLAI